MKRDIEFRAWDVKAKKMHYWNDGFNYRWFECQDKEDCHILMQSTGLYDKNGTDIYEGDLIIAPGCCDEQPHEVFYETSIYSGFSIRRDTHKTGLAARTEGKFAVEVIGNIYEHPELLK